LQPLYAEKWNAYVTHHKALVSDAPQKVRDEAEKMMSAGNHLAEHLGEAPAILVFCFNPKAMAITDAGLDRPSVVGGASIYTAVQNTLLACRAEGLGCVLTTLLCQCEAEVKALLSIPEDWYTAAAVPVGYPVLGGHGPIRRRPVSKLAFQDGWGAELDLEK
jgi:nitroreductase